MTPLRQQSHQILFPYGLCQGTGVAFLMGFTLGGLAMIANEPIVDERRPELTRLALVAAVGFFLLRN